MSPNEAGPGGASQRFPRVSGDEPDLALRALDLATFSPRERG